MGQNWLRLYSLIFTIFNILSTKCCIKTLCFYFFWPLCFVQYIDIIFYQAFHNPAKYHYLFDPASVLHLVALLMILSGMISLSLLIYFANAYTCSL